MKKIFTLFLTIGVLFSCAGNQETKVEDQNVEEPKNGLSIEQRKEIFKAISEMEKNAQSEADKKYDVVENVTDESMEQNVAENTKLKEEGQEVIMQQFKISDKIYWDIAAEGAMNGW